MKHPTKLNKWLLVFDRTFSGSVWRQLLILFAFMIAALLIGLIVCAFLPFGKEGGRLAFYEWALYLFIDGNALSNLYMDEYAGGDRPWVVVFAVMGSLLGVVVFGGMLISVLSNMLERRVENYRKGKNVYVKSGHHVILGYDEIVPSIIKQICSDKDAYVLLQSSLPSEDVAEKLHRSIAQDCEDRVIIKNGHRTSMDDLALLKLNQAVSIYVVGDRSNPSHDAMNIDCIQQVGTILSGEKAKGLPQTITTVFEEQETYAAMQVVDLFDNIRNLGVEFIPYNFYADWAKQIFVDGLADDNVNIDIDRQGITDTDSRHVHLVIVGMSNFGVTIGVEAAKILHFPNFRRGQNLTRITFIDQNADRERDLFLARYRHFFEIQSHWWDDERVPATKFKGEQADFLDVEFQFIKGDVFSSDIQNKLAFWATDNDELLTLVFALGDSRQNIIGAMSLPDEVYEQTVPVLVRQSSSSKFLSQLRENSIDGHKIVVEDNAMRKVPQKRRYANLYPFGMTDIPFDIDRRAQRMAECINHLYSKCDELGWKKIPTQEEVKACTLNDIHGKWIKLPVALQWSNLYSAYNIPYRIRSIQAMRAGDAPVTEVTEVSNDEVEALGRVEHDRWNVEKLLLGYRKPSEAEDYYAERNIIDGKKVKEMKNAHKELFIHCDIRPYTELDEIQEIDKEIIRYIPWFREMAKAKP